jgi:hypothetical protein
MAQQSTNQTVKTKANRKWLNSLRGFNAEKQRILTNIRTGRYARAQRIKQHPSWNTLSPEEQALRLQENDRRYELLKQDKLRAEEEKWANSSHLPEDCSAEWIQKASEHLEGNFEYGSGNMPNIEEVQRAVVKDGIQEETVHAYPVNLGPMETQPLSVAENGNVAMEMQLEPQVEPQEELSVKKKPTRSRQRK